MKDWLTLFARRLSNAQCFIVELSAAVLPRIIRVAHALIGLLAWRNLPKTLPVVFASLWIIVKIGGEVRKDFAVAVTSLPATMLDVGLDPNVEVQHAIDGIAQRLSVFQHSFSAGKPALRYGGQLIKVDREKYCGENSAALRMVDIAPRYFKKEFAQVIQVASSSDLEEEVAWEKPFVWVARQLRSLLKMRFSVVTVTVIEEDDGHVLSIRVKNDGASSNDSSLRSFRIFVGRLQASEVRDTIQDVILRVAFPQFTAVFRGARGGEDLEIEEFMVQAYPSTERTALLQLGTYMALRTAQGAQPLLNSRRADFILSMLEHEYASDEIKFSEHEVALARALLNRYLLERIDETDDFLTELMLSETAHYADHLGVSIAFDGTVDMEDRLTEGGRLIHHLLEGFRLSQAVPEVLATVSRRLNEDYDQNLLNRVEKSQARLLLHDDISLYAYGTTRLMEELQVSSPLNGDVKAELQSFVSFYDFQLRDLQNRFRIFDEEEAGSLDGTALLAFAVLGQIDRVSQIGERLLRSNLACASYFAGVGLGELVERKLRLPDGNLTSYQVLSRSLLRSSEKNGHRSFELFNQIHLAEARLGNHFEALRALGEAKKYSGETPWLFINRASIYMKQGAVEKAQWDYERSLELSDRRCIADRARWSSLDDRHNEHVRRSLPKEQWPIWLIDTDPAPRLCGTQAALRGLLQSLSMQGKAVEFAAAYRAHLLAEDYAALPDLVGAALTQYRDFQCSGENIPTPPIPAVLRDQFPIEQGRFTCN